MMTPSSQPKKMSPVHQAPPPPPPPPTTTDAIMPIISSSPSSQKPTKRYMVLLVLNYVLLFVGSLASSLLAKFYFVHNGSSRWVSTWVQCAGFPFLIIPIVLPYMFKLSPRKPFKKFTKRLILLSMIIGVLFFLNNFLISWGTSYLPVSTSSLLLSSQLVFTLILSCLIVKQKITFNNLNCVILLTISSVLLALISSHDHPEGVTKRMYFIGYFCTIGAGLLFSLYLPLMEKIYREVYCYEMVVEMQFVMEFTTTVIATIAMAAAGGFKEMKRESMVEYDLGHNMYWLTVMGNIISWQVCFMGTAGMVFLTSSLTGGVCMTALLALNVIGGVLVYGDNFSGPKAVSTVICAWGFCSYVYGLYVNREKGGTDEKNRAKEMTQILIDEH